MPYVAVAVGGAFGAVARFAIDGWVSERTGGLFPWGTLFINLSGAFLLGLLATLAIDRSVLSPEIRPIAMIGFLGAYTTFSTWMLDCWRLMQEGAWTLAAANLVGSALLGLVAVGAGIALGRLVP
jgi:fluoride exporter